MEQKARIDVKSPRFFIWKAIQYIGVFVSGVKPVISPTYRKWPQLLIDTKNCIYQRLENFVIPAITYKYQSSELM